MNKWKTNQSMPSFIQLPPTKSLMCTRNAPYRSYAEKGNQLKYSSTPGRIDCEHVYDFLQLLYFNLKPLIYAKVKLE